MILSGLFKESLPETAMSKRLEEIGSERECFPGEELPTRREGQAQEPWDRGYLVCFRHSKEASGARAGWAGKVDLADEVGEAGTQVAQAHGDSGFASG